MKKKDSELCYFCGAPAVSEEHVPPKNLFTEKLRNGVNLIKVPSCTEHNEGKSAIDFNMWIYISALNPDKKQLEYLPNLIKKQLGSSTDKSKKIRSVLHEMNNIQGESIWKNLRQLRYRYKPAKSMVKKKYIKYQKYVSQECFTNRYRTPLLYKTFIKQYLKKRIVIAKPLKYDKSLFLKPVTINERTHRTYQESILRGLYWNKYKSQWTEQLFIYPFSLIHADLNEVMGQLQNFIKQVEQSDNYVFNHRLNVDTDSTGYKLLIISVCLYKWYYFVGIFCNDRMYKILCDHYDQHIVKSFNEILLD